MADYVSKYSQQKRQIIALKQSKNNAINMLVFSVIGINEHTGQSCSKQIENR